VQRAIDSQGGDVVGALQPRRDEPFLFKPRYSAFDQTSLALVLRERSIERVIVTGAATEGRVVQSAIDAREDGFKATILQPARATASADLEETALAYASLVGGVHLAPSLLEARGDG
jgi:nicotinamidase-related amidase